MKTTERIYVEAEYERTLETGVTIINHGGVKQNKAFINIRQYGDIEKFAFLTEEQLQDLLDGLTIVKNELHKRNSSKRQKKKKPAPKPKKEIEVQMLLVNPIPIL